MHNEFEEWWKETLAAPESAIGVDKDFAKWIWLEATRRADKNVRLECVEICDKIRVRDIHSWECAELIRATILEE